MRKHGLFAVCLIAAVLFGINMFWPQLGAELKLRIKTAVAGDAEYIQMIEALGRDIAQGLSPDTVRQAMDESKPGEENELLSSAMEQWREAVKPALPEEKTAPVESVGENQLPDMVSTFIARQLNYGGQNIPDSVRLDMPSLPVEYTCPVSAAGSSGFGFREHPIENTIKFHYGTDFAANGGTDICAFAEGEVIAATWDDSYGNFVIIRHEGETETLYAHMSSIDVSEGDRVEMGQVIGQVGATGLATGPHLHFELKLSDVYLNPEYYL